ncbi:hypothetical protein ABPG75_012674 [Micractinium tetrahymenae]
MRLCQQRSAALAAPARAPARCHPAKPAQALLARPSQLPTQRPGVVAARNAAARRQTPRRDTAVAPSMRCRFLRGSSGPLGRPFVAVAACRRGGKLVVAATLMETGDSPQRTEELLGMRLQQNEALELGALDNGLRFVILPNRSPPARFEAHLEIHAGSVDEGEREQGIAHLVEHVTFLGSKKREGLLGTGARSNAYTDFHHTVFHVHSPDRNGNTGQPMLWQVLDALTEVAFEPEFLPSRIEKERKAVVAEAQMMNTIEYRVDCQLLQYLHWENALGCRFPIGKTDQVEKWERAEIMSFWARHYFPANATLYVVGDVDVQHTKELIKQTFGRIPPSLNQPSPAAATVNAELLAGAGATTAVDVAPGSSNGSSNGSSAGAVPAMEAVVGTAEAADATSASPGGRPSPNGAILESLPRPRGMVRPPVEHQWGCSSQPVRGNLPHAPVSVFRHRLLQLFQLSIFCKLPVLPINTLEDLRRGFMVRILLSVLQFRVNARYVEANPPFTGIELDISDSGREGCAVSTLTITSEPKDWQGAVQVAIQEVRRLQRFGVTRGELERYKTALLRDSEQLAEQSESVPSVDNLEFVMESLALGHTVLDQKTAHEYLLKVIDTISKGEVDALAKSLLSYLSHYNQERQLLEEYEADPSAWAWPGPTRATAIVACLPAFMDASGHSTGGGAPMQRGASLATTQHVDPAAVAAMEESGDEDDVPEGAVRFELEAADIEAALAEQGIEVEAREDVEVPDALLPDDAVQALVAERQPRFVPVDGASTSGDAPAQPPRRADGTVGVPGHGGVVQLRLSNGIKVNYRRTDNEPRGAMLRLVAAGGRATEGQGAGRLGAGVMALGTRTLSEAGTVGAWSREQVELFCISKLINCVLETDEEFVCMDFHFAVSDGGVASVLQLLHLFLEQPRWEAAAMERSKQQYLSHYRSLSKSLERATADRILQAMLGPDRRFRDPNPEEIAALDLEGMRTAVMRQIHAGNVEVSVVGDFEPAELEACVLKYLGSVSPEPKVALPEDAAERLGRPLQILGGMPLEQRHMTWHLKDSDERACAYIAGAAPNRWGNFTAAQQQGRRAAAGAVTPPVQLAPGAAPEEVARAAEIRRSHPLYASIALGLLTEIINSRLFTTVRDTLGLTYDVSFELSLFDRLPSGWWHVNVTSTPGKIQDAMMASLGVLRNLWAQPITQRELLRAKRTLITRHDSDLKDNLYWLGLLTHLQADCVPLKSLDCLRDLRDMYEAATVDDVYDAYAQFKFDDESVFTCIGTSGKEPLAAPSPILTRSQQASAAAGPAGAGMAKPPANMDPEAFMAAFKSMLQNMGQMQQQQAAAQEQQQQQGGR